MPKRATYEGLAAAQDRIAKQEQVVKTLLPGSEQHELAVKVLLLLQDSLVVMVEAQAVIQIARASIERARDRRKIVE